MSEVPKPESVEITLNAGTLRIRQQVFILGNISRVEVVQLPGPTDPVKGNTKYAVVSGFALLFLMNRLWAGQSDDRGGLLVFLAFLGGLVVYLKTRMPKKQRSALLVDTAGKTYTVLSTDDAAALEGLRDEIVAAINQPPSQEKKKVINGAVLGGPTVTS